VVAAEARVEIDIRVRRQRDALTLEKKLRALRPVDKRCSIEISGGLNRPPMERSAGTIRLFRTARKLAAELGIDLEESMSGGGSDGNFTAALGIPTLDGIGAVGDGAHATHEHIVVNTMPQRAALLASLLTM
jgi:glutamate carboxypeptidase